MTTRLPRVTRRIGAVLAAIALSTSGMTALEISSA